MIAVLVTLAQAKAHLRIATPPGHVDDPAVQLKLDGAEAAVLRYVGKEPLGAAIVAEWTDDPESTDPDAIAAILLQLGELWRFRGDDPGGVISSPGRDPNSELSPQVTALLRRFATPVISVPTSTTAVTP